VNVLRPDAQLVWVSSSGRVLATTEGEAALIGRSVDEVFGLDWAAIVRAGREGKPTETRLGRYVVELVRKSPELIEGASLRALPASDRELELELVLGTDATTRATHELAMRFARTDLPLSISAEPGSGAELLARAVHAASNRRAAPFVVLRGASLDAERLLADADPSANGTLYVDGLDDAPLAAQQRLAAELATGALTETRLLASVSPRLRERVEHGSFALEVYRMLRGATVVLPPLREREDLAQLVSRVLRTLGAGELGVSSDFVATLAQHTWPGNLQELRDALAFAVARLGAGRELSRSDLPTSVLHPSPQAGASGPSRRDAERAALESALRSAQGNLSVAARKLGVARTTLYRMLDRHGLAERRR
jgi:sigma-54 dependent transcriptional regulator, acetoin dehydrogenase operon transcriptional activator AcoR